MDKDANILYVSETIARHVGLLQVSSTMYTHSECVHIITERVHCSMSTNLLRGYRNLPTYIMDEFIVPCVPVFSRLCCFIVPYQILVDYTHTHTHTHTHMNMHVEL